MLHTYQLGGTPTLNVMVLDSIVCGGEKISERLVAMYISIQVV